MLRGPESSGLQQQQQQEQEPEAGTSNGIAKNNGDPKSGGSRAKILAEQRRQQRNVAASKILPTLSRSTSETETSSLLAPRRSSVTDHLFNQEIIIDDELTVNVTGYRRSTVRLFFYRLLCVLSLGVVYIVCRWFPALELNITSVRCPMNAAELVSVKNQWGEVSIEQVHRDPFDGGYVADIFPNHPEPSHNESRSNTPRQPLSTIIYFDYRYIKFIFNPNTGLFETTQYWQDPEWTSVDGVLEGVSNTLLLSRRRLIFGENEVIIAEKPTFRLLVDEVLHPFFIFQVLSMLLWCLDEYYYYAACIFFITVISTTSTLLETKETMRRLRDMSRFTCNVRVWRGEELIPGDIFEITPSGYLPIVPCDAILLDGDCIVNESMLTGESVPVSKTSITDAELNDIDFEEEDPANSNRMARYFLFSGTKVILSEPGALALVVRVGFNTTKGALVRSILFPKPNTFMFYRDSFRFIGVLGLVAFFGFLASLYNFINFAIARLRRGLIYCTSPPRVNICGKIEAMCFDKTGTLTMEGLDVLGFRFTVPSEPQTQLTQTPLRFSDIYRSVEDVLDVPDAHSLISPQQDNSYAALRRPSFSSVRLASFPCHPNGAETDFPYPMIVCAMAVCHSIKVVDSTLIGDPMDIRMFEFTGWDLEEDRGLGSGSLISMVVRPPGDLGFKDVMSTADRAPSLYVNGNAHTPVLDEPRVYTELGVIRSFEFVSSLRRMSVVVRRLRYSKERAMKEFEVFVKGAPEVMKSICNPASLPPNYDSLLKSYAHHGYRVIAVAWRRLENDIEKNLDFLGFIVFENKLKPGTTPIVRELKTASIRQIMCTGDNVLTAISVSRECGLVEPTSKVFVPRLRLKSLCIVRYRKLFGRMWIMKRRWASLPVMTLDPVTLKPLSLPPSSAGRNGEVVVPVEFDYSLAVTGDVFQWMLEYANQDSFRRMLVKEQKQILVERLQEIGYCVGFCGDGANDCGALKAADVGLSLSEAEASVAAPFTSKSTEIDCVTRVIREGRAALVTSFSCFKYMAVYSLIQFTSVSLLYSLASSLADFQFMFIDMGLIIPVAVFMSESGAHPKLDRKRPTASLVGKKVLSSMLGQVVIQAVFQGLIFWWVRTTEWYIPTRTDVSEKKMRCHENSVVFLLSCFQYVAVAMAFCSGPPYRESVWKNSMYLFIRLFISFFCYYFLKSSHLQRQIWASRFSAKYLVLPFVSKAVGWVGVYARVCLDARERGTGVAGEELG
ncbi:hypothetical protein BC829DRAFT_427684 [Chytridium lagenaria]|nr:hypothetical protein BC829DRAFT_427684 [Chytridium lagenaria]